VTYAWVKTDKQQNSQFVGFTRKLQKSINWVLTKSLIDDSISDGRHGVSIDSVA